jgi:hypothetical protein
VINGFSSTTRGCSGIGWTTVGSAGTGGIDHFLLVRRLLR